MTSQIPQAGIRPNPVGDWPKVDPTAFVDPSAQLMGNVVIGPKVYVGPMTVIRADEVDAHGKVHPVIIQEGTCIQIMHIGPYSEEMATVDKMDAFAREKGYKLHGKHHEIYIGDPMRAQPEKLKTILRHPVLIES